MKKYRYFLDQTRPLLYRVDESWHYSAIYTHRKDKWDEFSRPYNFIKDGDFREISEEEAALIL